MSNDNRIDIENRVKGIIINALDIEEKNMSGDLHLIRDLNGSSLGLVEMLMNLESEFKLSIPENDAEKLMTLNQIVTYILSKTA